MVVVFDVADVPTMVQMVSVRYEAAGDFSFLDRGCLPLADVSVTVQAVAKARNRRQALCENEKEAGVLA